MLQTILLDANNFIVRLSGGELFERIAKKGAFPEDIARHHMKSLTQCIQVRYYKELINTFL